MTFTSSVATGTGSWIMTYKEQLQVLLEDCVRKANAYLETVIANGQFATESTVMHEEWLRAESYYQSCLDDIKSNSFPHDGDMQSAPAHA